MRRAQQNTHVIDEHPLSLLRTTGAICLSLIEPGSYSPNSPPSLPATPPRSPLSTASIWPATGGGGPRGRRRLSHSGVLARRSARGAPSQGVPPSSFWSLGLSLTQSSGPTVLEYSRPPRSEDPQNVRLSRSAITTPLFRKGPTELASPYLWLTPSSPPRSGADRPLHLAGSSCSSPRGPSIVL